MKLCWVLCLAVTFVGCASAAGLAARTECVTVAPDGSPAVGYHVVVGGVALSADGRYVAFSSDAGNLVPGDSERGGDVFVRDRLTDVTERISVGPAGAQEGGPCWCAAGPSMSADGRFVAFMADEPSANRAVFLWDRRVGTPERVSLGPSQIPFTASLIALSGNGRYLAFNSLDRLDEQDTYPNSYDGYIWDRMTSEVSLVAVNSQGEKADGYVSWLSLNRDGRFVAFYTSANNLVPDDRSGGDIFVRDRLLGKTECVSTGPDGKPLNTCYGPTALSADGRFVAFLSTGSELMAPLQVYVRDRRTGALELISATPSGQPTAMGVEDAVQLSANGRFVVFTSEGMDLVPGKTDCHRPEVFVRDRLTRTTRMVSVNTTGQENNGCSDIYQNLALDADGTCAAFASYSTNLTEDGSAGYFVRSRLKWPVPWAAFGSLE